MQMREGGLGLALCQKMIKFGPHILLEKIMKLLIGSLALDPILLKMRLDVPTTGEQRTTDGKSTTHSRVSSGVSGIKEIRDLGED
jgi:hypothetical protein